MKTKSQIVEQVKRHLKEANLGLGAQRENTQKCQAFEAGDYQQYTDKVQFTTQSGQKKRVTVMINKIKPYKNAVKGFLAQNRRKPNYLARLESSVQATAYSKYANDLSEFMRNNMNADQVETQQDGDMLTCGLGVVETAMSYGEGFASKAANGEAVMACIDPQTFWYDPSARETNLLDARYKGVTKKFHVDDALDLFSDSTEEDFEQTSPVRNSDYEYGGDLGSYDRIKYDWSDKREGMCNVHFYQWYDIEKYYRAENPATGLANPYSVQAILFELETIAQEVSDDDFDPRAEIMCFGAEVKERLETAFGESFKAEQFRRKVFYTAVVSGDKCFSAFKSQHQDGFTLKVKTGDYDAKNKIWIGMINSMMEPQKYYNKALTELMFIIAANSKGGVIVEEDAVEDIEEFEDQYAKTDAVCVVRAGALSGAAGPKIRDKRSPFQPTGYEQIISLSDAAIADVSGIDKTFLGSSENRLETASLQRLRIKQITATLACYVDSICLYTKEHARMMLDLMRVYAQNNRGMLFRILGQDGSNQFERLSEDKLFAEYEIIIEESPVTMEERQQMAEKLTMIGDKLATVGDIQTAKSFYALSARYMSLDPEDLQQISKILIPDGPQIDPAYVQQLEALVKQLQDNMTQVQIQKVAAEAQKVMSETALNKAKLPEVSAGVHQKSAQTTKLLEESQQLDVETKLLQSGNHPTQLKAKEKANEPAKQNS